MAVVVVVRSRSWCFFLLNQMYRTVWTYSGSQTDGQLNRWNELKEFHALSLDVLYCTLVASGVWKAKTETIKQNNTKVARLSTQATTRNKSCRQTHRRHEVIETSVLALRGWWTTLNSNQLSRMGRSERRSFAFCFCKMQQGGNIS